MAGSDTAEQKIAKGYAQMPCSCSPNLADCKKKAPKKAARCARERRNQVRRDCPQVCKKYCVIFSVVRAGLEFEKYA